MKKSGVSQSISLSIATSLSASLLVIGCSGSSPDQEPAPFTPTNPVTTSAKIENILPPGNWGNFSADQHAAYSGRNDVYATEDFHPNVDDQRQMYWNFEFKPGAFMDISGATPESNPTTGSAIYRDDFGVPVIYGDTVFDAGYAAGYAAANDRTFLLDAARRQASGQFAFLAGEGADGANYGFDVQQITVTYTDEEYQAIFDGLSADAQEMANGYLAGVNQRFSEYNANPNTLPGEYQLLSQSSIKEYTLNEMMALGVFMTRFVASEGGDEFANVQALRDLEALHGDKATARQVFKDVSWVDDRKAAVTVPVGETFTNIPEKQSGGETTSAERDAIFETMADFADTLPLELAEGPGTGAARPGFTPPLVTLMRWLNIPRGSDFLAGMLPEQDTTEASYMAVISSKMTPKTQNGETLIINGPQLGYSYPTLLWEYEFHGGDYHARGVTVPGLPVVGIGYSINHAWGVTTGNSKTRDSFIVELDETDVTGESYFHDGVSKKMNCYDKPFTYRQNGGTPLPLPNSDTQAEVRVCRTVHGPVVARSDDGKFARALQFGMWMKEIDTIEAVLGWKSATTFAEFHEAMKKASWNENLMYADNQGNIAYYHPGLHPLRAPDTEQRLPNKGDGTQDHLGTIPFDDLPHSINPAQGYLANWNNKPAHGWGEGVSGNATSLPSGPDARVKIWHELLEAKDDWTFEDLKAADRIIGLRDPRALFIVDLLTAYRDSGNVTLEAEEAELINRIAAWASADNSLDPTVDDHSFHYNPELDIEDPNATDRPGETIFGYVMHAIYVSLLADDVPGYKTALEQDAEATTTQPDPNAHEGLYARMRRVGNHEYDAPGLHSLAVKALAQFDQETVQDDYSDIPLNFDFTNGGGSESVFETAMELANSNLKADFGDGGPDTYMRETHKQDACSLTGAMGPCMTMPYQDRGSWIHIVGYGVPE